MALTRPRLGQFDTTVSSLSDPITVIHGGATSANVDVGFLMNRANGLVSNVALYWNEAGNAFVTAFTSNSGITDSNIAVTSYANIVTGGLTVSGAILPSANVTYDLGSPTQRFRTLYISGNTIDMGGALISSGTSGVTITHNTGSQFTLAAAGTIPTTSNASGSFGNLLVSSGVVSTSVATGALQVTGGAGITGNLFIGGNLDVAGTTIFRNIETVTTTEYVSTINATNLYASTIGNTGAQGTFGNITTTNGLFWANGIPYSVPYTSSGAGNITVSGSLLTLPATGPGATTVGSSTAIPIITTDPYGRVVALTSSAVSTTINLAGTSVAGATLYSYYFNGSSGLAYPSSSNLQFGSGDFTIEFWMNAGSSQQPYAMITDASTNNQATAIGVGQNNGGTAGKISFQAAGGSGTVNSSASVLDNTWHHIACVKYGSNGYIFVDGVLSGSTGSWSGVTNAYLSAGELGRSAYGSGNSGDNTYTGYLSNFRVVKGTALYTSNFTVPSLTLTAVSGTQLLTLQNATVVDNSTNAFSLTTVGTAPAVGTSPTLPGASSTTTGNVSGGGTLSFASTNGVLVTVGQSYANIATPQDIRTTASPTFGNATIAGTVSASNLTASGTVSASSLTVSGVSKYSGNIVAASGTSSTSTTTGAAVVVGGIGISGNIYSDRLYVNSGLFWSGNGYPISTGGGASTAGIAGQVQYNSGGSLGASNIYYFSGNSTAAVVGGIASSSATTGQLQVVGGAGITGNLYVGGNITVAGNITTTGNVINVTITGNSGQFFGNTSGFNALYAGIMSGYFVEPQMVMQLSSNFNGFGGLNQQNINSGSLASTDTFWTPDNGTAIDTYLDVGIASSTYSYPGFNLIKPNDSYVISYGNATTGGGNLLLATGAANDIVFAVQGVNPNNEVMRITRANVVAVKGNVAVTNTIYGQGIYDNGNRVLSTSTGSGNLSISGTAITLPATGPGAITFGSSTSIPVITTDIYGRVVALTSSAVSTTISLAGTSGTGTVAGGGTLTFAGSNGVTATISSSTVTVGIPQAIATTSAPTFAGATINGTLTTTTINASTIGNTGATLTGTLSTASQTNITALGNLTSLSVVGTSTRGGKAIVTNFTGNSAPASPQQGDEWWYSAGNTLYKYIYDGTGYSWVNITPSLFNAATAATASTLALRDTGGSLTATTFIGKATSAQYADLAENYVPDCHYEPGTVVIFGGEQEITTTDKSHDPRVAGVISTDPAYLMNSECVGLPVAFTGRVPCQVQGPVTKGQLLVTSNKPGVAHAIDNTQFVPGCVIGKSLENITTNEITTIEVVVGRF